MIKLTNLNKYYNKGKSNQIHVIDNTSLELPDTGLVVFLGKSGSGKSTLLNVIGGLDKANGQITYDNMMLSGYKPTKIDKYRNNHIGYVFQNYNNLNELSVYENLRVALNIYKKLNPNEIEKRIKYCLNAVGLYKYRNKLCSQLSGGQQQRVSIARALVKNSKIIIADEPTGNLDSQNSIEVMNILSKIAESRLVLLVTHNEELASFYSNRILRIVDGKIISDTINQTGKASIDVKDNSNIYLKDLHLEKNSTPNLDVEVYSHEGENIFLDLKIVKSGGKYYLQSSLPIEVINNDTNIKLIDEHYEAISKEDVEAYEFSTEDFNDEKYSKFSFKKLLRRIINAISQTLSVKKRTKAGYFLFGCIGAITALAMMMLSSANYYDLSDYQIYDGYVLDNYNKDNINKTTTNFNRLLDASYIDSFLCSDNTYPVSLLTNNQIVPQVSLNKSSIDAYANEKLLAGETPNNDKVTISSKLYSYINANYTNIIGVNTNEIIGLKIKIGSYTKEICGITDNNNANIISFSYDDFINYNNSLALDNLGLSNVYIPIDDEITSNMIGSYDKNSTNQVIVSYNYSNTYKKGSTIKSNNTDTTYIVSGYYNDYETTKCKFYVSQDHYLDELENSTNVTITYGFSYIDELDLVDGHMPNNNNEIVLSIHNDIEKLKQIYSNFKNYTVVGHFRPTSYEDNFLAYTTYENAWKENKFINLAQMYLRYYNGSFTSTYALKISDENIDAARALLTDGFTLTKASDFYIKNLKSYNSEMINIMLPVAIICLAIVAIYSFFMIRSKMMFDIKNIGILRAIGMKKRDFILHYLIDTIILTTFTSIIGYLIFTLGFNYIISEFTLLQSMLNLSSLFIILGIILLYLISIIFGLLPIFLLLRKSPQEILNKYDI